MELTGSIESIIFRNADNGWTVLELLTDDDERLTAVGVLPLCNKGERVTLEGDFTAHPRFGRQFKAESYRTLAPSSLAGIESYLGSGLIRGIGPSTARLIVNAFGMDTLDMLDNHPEKLMTLPGIGPKKQQMIAASYRETTEMRNILLALEPYGITVGQATKLYAIYGNLVLARIEEDPYRLIEDVDGIGFLTADKIAQKNEEYRHDSPGRMRAGLLYSMNLAKNEYGHTYLPKNSLVTFAAKLLGVEEFSVEDAVDALIEQGAVLYRMVGDDDAVFLPYLFKMEGYIARRLKELAENKEENPFLLAGIGQEHRGIRLASQQLEAVKRALTEGMLVITGGPGTGKTTIIREITEILSEMQSEFALCAPTGRAAKRMTEATGFEAKTIHRLLEYQPGEGFRKNEDDPLLFDTVIVDETSMVDVPLMYALLKAIPDGTRLILVGDADQLPPVGCGNVLKDIIESDAVPVVRLTEIFRQAAESLIVRNAHAVNRGEMPVLSPEDGLDFRFFEYMNEEEALKRIVELCMHPAPVLDTNEPLLDLQVLAPMKKGTLGVNNINKVLQAALNPPSPGKKEQVIGGRLFREGDKIMQMQNDYKVEWSKRAPGGGLTEGTGAFNGDLGTLYRIDTSARNIMVLFDDDRLAQYDFAAAEALDLAYCISIHKSQGSEFPIVLLPLCGGSPLLLTRNLLYTAITRAKRGVCCVGRSATIRSMVNNNRSMKRYTALKHDLEIF
ncbi:MAG: ATP-dependent RecD-like DNA helicase [Clostridia bacterium]|nr:ATP-dependent RecD-like DNA helicase [Clostridia bacterium]